MCGMIEKAAIALWEHDMRSRHTGSFDRNAWRRFEEWYRERYRAQARIVLKAVYGAKRPQT